MGEARLEVGRDLHPSPSTMHLNMPTAQIDIRTQTTHRCLFIPEVLALICEACIDPPDVESVAARNRGMRWLVRLARTCKTIYAVAIRCVWQNVTEIAILAGPKPKPITSYTTFDALELDIWKVIFWGRKAPREK